MHLLRLQHCHDLAGREFPEMALTIGNFDGIHIGHQAIIQQVKTTAAWKGLATGLILFEPQPTELFKPGQNTRIYSLRQKLEHLKLLKLDYVICLEFKQEFAQLDPVAFIEWIIARLNTRYIIIGDDFRFGYRRSGDFSLLCQQAARYHYQAEQMPTFLFGNERVSSTRIRQQLAQSDFITAGQLLGRHYTITGKVTYGDQRGRQLGYPTANLVLRKVRPVHGIYAVKVHGIAESPLAGAASIGWRPTIGDNRYLLETYLLDFNQDIYGRRIAVEFVEKIRDEAKFDSLEAMQQQMATDVSKIRQILLD